MELDSEGIVSVKPAAWLKRYWIKRNRRLRHSETELDRKFEMQSGGKITKQAALQLDAVLYIRSLQGLEIVNINCALILLHINIANAIYV